MENKRTKNKRMKYISVSLVLVLLCAICVCLLCIVYNAKDKHDINELHQTEVVKNDLAEYGNFVWAQSDKIYRFNRKTETFYTACTDPECDGKCPVDCITTGFAGVHDQKLYFLGWQQFTHVTMLAYQDIVTGKTQVIKTMSEAADPNAYLTFIDADWWYYKCMLLKDGGDASKPSDYEPYICRISLDGAKEQTVCALADAEFLYMAADGKVVTGLTDKLYVTDAETGQRDELFNLTQNGYKSTMSSAQYYDGKMYFTALSPNYATEQYTGAQQRMSFLVCIDLASGQAERVVEQPVENFTVTEQGIYYVPFELRYLFLPDDPERNSDKIRYCLFEESVYFCDHDGNNARVVYTNDKLDFTFYFTVIDNTLYGWLFDYDEQEKQYSSSGYFGAVSFDTGRIVRTEKPDKQ